MKILILAAGYGTRLYKISKDTPKPLLTVGQRPLIDHLLDKVNHMKNLKELIVVTNNKFEKNFIEWSKQVKGFPAPITVVNDGTNTPEERLGSIGDMAYVLDHHPVDDDLLVMGGDNLFDYRLDQYLVFAGQKAPHVSIGLYDIGRIEEASKFGVVEVDGQGKVVSFEEKPEKPKSSLVAMCFYYFPRASLPLIGKYLAVNHKADKAGDYIRWLTEESTVYGFKFEGKWYDIGSVESYYEAQEKFKS